MSRRSIITASIFGVLVVAAVVFARPVALKVMEAAIPKIQAAIEEKYGVAIKADNVVVRWDWLWPEFEFRNLSLRRPDGSADVQVKVAKARVGLEATIRKQTISITVLQLEGFKGEFVDGGNQFASEWEKLEVIPDETSYRFLALDRGVAVNGVYSQIPLPTVQLKIPSASVTDILAKIPPHLLGKSTDKWLREAIAAGFLTEATLSYTADDIRFASKLNDIKLKFDERWPALEDTDGHIEVLSGKSANKLSVELTRARFSGADLVDCKGIIPDLSKASVMLSLSCGLHGTGSVIREFLDRGPVSSSTKPILELVNPGEARDMQLSLKIPLEESVKNSKQTVSGEIVLKDADLDVVKPKLSATNVRGTIQFAGDTLSLKGIQANVFNHSWTIDGDRKKLTISGTVPVTDLATLLALPKLNELATGAIPGRAELQFVEWDKPAARRLEVKLASTLEKLQLIVPAPFDKLSGSDAALTVVATLKGETTQSVDAKIENAGDISAAVTWAAKANELKAEVGVADIAIEPWQEFLESFQSGQSVAQASGQKSQPSALTTDLKIKTKKVAWRDLEFADVALQFQNRQKESKIAVRSLELLGEVTFGSPFASATTVGKFEKVILPRWPKGSDPVSDNERLRHAWKVTEIPGLSLNIGRLRVGDQLYGQVEIVTSKKDPTSMNFDRLKVTGPELQVTAASGSWNSEKTSIDLLWKIKGTTFPTRFESMTGLELQDAEFRTNWSWEGGPDQFALKRLSGRLDGNVRAGVFLGVSSGAVSMFNFLSFAGDDTEAKKLRFFKAKMALGFKDGTIDVAPFSALFGSVYTKVTGKAYAHTEKLALEAGITPSVDDLPADGSEPGNLLSHKYKIGGSWGAPEVSLKVF